MICARTQRRKKLDKDGARAMVHMREGFSWVAFPVFEVGKFWCCSVWRVSMHVKRGGGIVLPAGVFQAAQRDWRSPGAFLRISAGH